jgi:hypothetical protein
LCGTREILVIEAFSATTLGGDVYVAGRTAGNDVLVSKFDGLGNHIQIARISRQMWDQTI